MKNIPAIALRRRQEATAKFLHKLEVLEQLLTDEECDRFPKRASDSSFAAWEDSELGVLPVSRSVIYDKSAEYLALRQRMDHLLERVHLVRTKVGKKANLESELRKKLEDTEERAQSYVNQYSSAKAELAEARKDIEQLNSKLRRQIASDAKVSPLRGSVTTKVTPLNGRGRGKNE
jgi:chromosome segregation ATPase